MSEGIRPLFFRLFQTSVFSCGQDLQFLSAMNYWIFFHVPLFQFHASDNCCSHLGWFLAYCTFSRLTFFACTIVMVLIQKVNGVGLTSSLQFSVLPNGPYSLSIFLKCKICTTEFADSASKEYCEVFPISIFLCWKLCLACIQSRQRQKMVEEEGNCKVTNAWKIYRSLDFLSPHIENMRYVFLHFIAVLVHLTTITTETSENKWQVLNFYE